MTTIQNLGVAIRKWNDISSKIKAVAAGGGTVTVLSLLATVFPHFEPAPWLVSVITLGVALVAGYARGDKVSLGVAVNATAADGTVTTTAQSLDLPDIPLHPEVAAIVAKQLEHATEVGAAEADGIAADGRHEATPTS